MISDLHRLMPHPADSPSRVLACVRHVRSHCPVEKPIGTVGVFHDGYAILVRCTAVFKTLRGARFHERWTEHEVVPLSAELKRDFAGLTRDQIEDWISDAYG